MKECSLLCKGERASYCVNTVCRQESFTVMVGVLVAKRMRGGRSSARAALRAASTGSMPANGGHSSNSW